MARIRSKNTKPEMRVRRVAHKCGYRFRLHRGDLPGRPDLVFSSRRKAIFVNGCFWHRHEGCTDCSEPKSRQEYWQPKFAATKARDQQALRSLREMGWLALVIWECETGTEEELAKVICEFLGPTLAPELASNDGERKVSNRNMVAPKGAPC